MKVRIFIIALWGFTFGAAFGAPTDLDGLVADLNLQAEADPAVFDARLSAQFGLPVPDVEALMEKMAVPADAFLCLQLSFLTREPLDVVVKTYKAKKGEGWGVIAQELGIKPGSAEFRALKGGRYTLTGKPAVKAEKDHGKSKQKGKKQD